MNVSFAMLILIATGAVFLLVFGVGLAALNSMRRQARESGYPSLSAYLGAVPSSDAEKRQAVDLALKGLVICFLGLMFPPLLLVGLIPLFYGGRKVVWASMGLGLVDDVERPTA
jgi:hypothetical protein